MEAPGVWSPQGLSGNVLGLHGVNCQCSMVIDVNMAEVGKRVTKLIMT